MWELEDAYQAVAKKYGIVLTPRDMTLLAKAEISPAHLEQKLEFLEFAKIVSENPFDLYQAFLDQLWGAGPE